MWFGKPHIIIDMPLLTSNITAGNFSFLSWILQPGWKLPQGRVLRRVYCWLVLEPFCMACMNLSVTYFAHILDSSHFGMILFKLQRNLHFSRFSRDNFLILLSNFKFRLFIDSSTVVLKLERLGLRAAIIWSVAGIFKLWSNNFTFLNGFF
jgi:hypothetical protein